MADKYSADFNPSQSQANSMNIFLSLLVPALILWYIYWRLSRRHMYELAEKLPGPAGLPLIGNALDLTGTSHSKNLLPPNRKSKIIICFPIEIRVRPQVK